MGNFWVKVNEAAKIDGWMSLRELHWLAMQARHHELVIEVGTWKGRSAWAMGQVVNGKVICVDHFSPWTLGPSQRAFYKKYLHGWEDSLDIYSECLKNLDPLIKAGKVEVIKGERLEVAKTLEPLRGKVGMVFIDGDHGYGPVKEDIMAYGRLLKYGGLLCGHDYDGEVKKAVDELLPGAQKYHRAIWWVKAGNVTERLFDHW